MKWFSRIVSAIDDRVNPIVIKELRQAVQGRYVSGVFALFLVVQVCVIAGFLLNGDFDNL